MSGRLEKAGMDWLPNSLELPVLAEYSAFQTYY